MRPPITSPPTMPPRPPPQPDRCGGDCWKVDGAGWLGRLDGDELGEDGAE